MQEREYLLDQIQNNAEVPWRSGSFWTFKNDAKVFGSPMFDAARNRFYGIKDDPMPQVIELLNKAE